MINQILQPEYFPILLYLIDPSCTSIENGCFVADQSCER